MSLRACFLDVDSVILDPAGTHLEWVSPAAEDQNRTRSNRMALAAAPAGRWGECEPLPARPLWPGR